MDKQQKGKRGQERVLVRVARNRRKGRLVRPRLRIRGRTRYMRFVVTDRFYARSSIRSSVHPSVHTFVRSFVRTYVRTLVGSFGSL